ncbi:primosomal protein N' [Peptococcaceae bacterium 1198_IL3148]
MAKVKLLGQYAEVVVEVPSRQVDRPFHYRVPESLQPLSVGSRVLVPFGNRTIAGYVMGYSDPPTAVKIKDIKAVVGGGLSPELMELARWLAKKYLCTLSESLHCVLGPGREPKKVPQGLFAAISDAQLVKLKLTAKQQQVMEQALAHPGLNKTELAQISSVSTATVTTLIKKNLLRWSSRTDVGAEQATEPLPQLTEEQRQVLGAIAVAVDEEAYSAFLLHGVTGSGKTEVYLNIIARVLSQNRQAIVLVPEISLTPQMVSIFKKRFGNAVAVLHSRLSDGERYAERERIEQGQAQVVLGARSAIFAPVPKLGIIIIDEEHEPLYKQEENPKYHCRDVALHRAKLNNAVVILGSATPALESYCRTEINGPYQLLSMTKRVADRPLPEVAVVDMREEMASGNKSIFSRALLNKMAVRLEKQQQVVLFINRRGYATFIVCRQCGEVLKCPHCDISLTYHNDGVLRCHYCNYQRPTPKKCPHCQSDAIGFFGVGTQRVEEEVRRFFPQANVLRMDGDTTSRKGAHQEILDAFKAGEGDVLVGTQMIAKGLDIPGVTLVGVVSADTMLHMPDFRAAERTFQLLTQVAGRAGRGVNVGETIIQTYSPEHYSIVTAQSHDYAGFYNKEMNLRRALKYPPFYYLSRILITGEDEQLVEVVAKQLKDILAQTVAKVPSEQQAMVLGPAPAALSKVQKKYRWQIMIKARTLVATRAITGNGVKQWEENNRLRNRVSVSIDMEPQFLM